MRALLIIIIVGLFTLPISVFHLLPERYLFDMLKSLEKRTNGRVSLIVDDFSRGFPLNIQLRGLKVSFKKRDILYMERAFLRTNPYMLILKGLPLKLRADVSGGMINLDVLLGDKSIEGCLEAQALSLKDIRASSFFNSFNDGLMYLRLCRSGNKNNGLVEVHNIRMKDLVYKGMVFPSRRITDMVASFSIDGESIRFKVVDIRAEGFNALFYGELKGRTLKGNLEVYTSAEEDLFRDFKDYRKADRIFIIPVKADIVRLLKK
ncbi:MAG: hypothetical protein D6710_09010 [Nitrospirae bacterium]|nr:MAG: hypothetical protein D6710_09010 [Nitrospirota bacterium]